MSNVNEIMKSLNKKFGDDFIHRGIAKFDYQRIPFTSPRLNYMTYGGLPMGKLIEFYGENGGGKTTTSLDIISNYQRMESAKRVVYADLENTLDYVWATKLGVDVDDLIIINPTNQGAETIFELLLQLIDTGEVGLVVIDSLGVMVSNQALDKTVEEKTYGGIAMALTNFSKKAEMLCHKHNCTLIGINQVRDDLNSMYGGITTVGGKAWKHNVSVRLEFRMGKYFDENGKDLNRGAENPAGNYVQVAMKKNKTCKPDRRTGYYTLSYRNGVEYLNDLIEVCIKYGIVEQRGSWFSIIDTETGEILLDKLQGQSNLKAYLENKENESVLDRVEKLVESKI